MDTTPSQIPLVAPTPTPVGARILPLRFTGSAGEFFRIWIVNVALTVVTLGIYGAWAKVRTRRYFYGHTWLDGYNFEYTASPIAILIGHLVVGGAFLVYSLTSNFTAEEHLGFSLIGVVLLVAFVLLTPWLIHKSLRFTAHNTVYRGLRFRFHGTVAEAYAKFLGWPVLSAFTFMLLYPYVTYLQRQYLAGNAGYGTARTSFSGRPGDVYITYLIGVALGIGTYTICGVLFVLSFLPLIFTGGNWEDPTWLVENLTSSIAFVVMAVLAYLLLLLGLAAVAQFIKASLMNYTLNNTELNGQVRFASRVNPWTLTWIQVSNLLAQLFTLGLATPWAAVRRARYVLSCISLTSTGSLDDFTAGLSKQQDALGEAATDFFDIGIGF